MRQHSLLHFPNHAILLQIKVLLQHPIPVSYTHLDFAENVPILDYHCHINPQGIAEDRKFENITQVWLGGDHYKWRQMRSNGVEEKYITGDASDREKFQKWAETIPKLIGNPLYHWSHLELKKYFGYDGYLNGCLLYTSCVLYRKQRWKLS